MKIIKWTILSLASLSSAMGGYEFNYVCADSVRFAFNVGLADLVPKHGVTLDQRMTEQLVKRYLSLSITVGEDSSMQIEFRDSIAKPMKSVQMVERVGSVKEFEGKVWKKEGCLLSVSKEFSLDTLNPEIH